MRRLQEFMEFSWFYYYRINPELLLQLPNTFPFQDFEN